MNELALLLATVEANARMAKEHAQDGRIVESFNAYNRAMQAADGVDLIFEESPAVCSGKDELQAQGEEAR